MLRLKPVSERQIEELIEKGGTVQAEKPTAPSPTAAPIAAAGATGDGKLHLVQLRLPKELIDRIDATRSKRTVPPSRHSWILEAVLEKLG